MIVATSKNGSSAEKISTRRTCSQREGGFDVLQQKGDADFTMTQPAKKHELIAASCYASIASKGLASGRCS